MSRKRIALVIDSLAGGGAEKIVITLAQEMLRQGHEPHLLLMQNSVAHDVPSNIPVHVCFDQNEKNIDSIFNVKRSVGKLKNWIVGLEQNVGKFDVFFSNLDRSNFLMIQAKIAPLFCVIHNAVEDSLIRQRKLGPFAYLKMVRAKRALNGQHLITVSKGIEREIVQGKRITPASIRTIYNPFDFDEIERLSNADVPALPEGDFFIHVGRFAKQKRHDILFQALRLTKNKLPIVLLCHNQKKALKAAKKFGVVDRIILPGFQRNPFPWVKHANALVLSSDYEGLPTVLIESLAVGTPVVSTNCPYGPDEILTGELANFLVPVRDPAALALKLDEVLTLKSTSSKAEILSKVKAEEIAKAYIQLI